MQYYSDYQTVMWLPSLANEESFVRIYDASEEDAEIILSAFNRHVKNNAPDINDTGDPEQHQVWARYKVSFAIDELADEDIGASGDFELLLSRLAHSTVHGARGRRAVFINMENRDVNIGNTVIYNPRWATFGLVDDTIPAVLLEASDAFNEYC